MKHTITSQQLTTTLFTTAVLLLPVIAFAHGAEDLTGPVDADGHHAGASELLQAWSPRWWGLLAVASLLTTGLSFLVWKYLQVAVPKKAVAGTDIKK